MAGVKIIIAVVKKVWSAVMNATSFRVLVECLTNHESEPSLVLQKNMV